MLVCYQQHEFKELTEMTVRDSIMQPNLRNTQGSINKYVTWEHSFNDNDICDKRSP